MGKFLLTHELIFDRELYKQFSFQNWLFFIALLALIFFIGVYWNSFTAHLKAYFNRKKRINKIKMWKIKMWKIKRKLSIKKFNYQKGELSARNCDQLRQKFEAFEEGQAFLDKQMTFSKFVERLETNSKYLRCYLKQHINKDYSTYINDLRVEFVVDKLQNDLNYRQYKLTYLAEEAGFSSYNTFSIHFKRIMGISPSQYLKLIAVEVAQ